MEAFLLARTCTNRTVINSCVNASGLTGAGGVGRRQRREGSEIGSKGGGD